MRRPRRLSVLPSRPPDGADCPGEPPTAPERASLGEAAERERRSDGAHWWWLRTGVATAPTVSVVRISLDADKCQGHNRCYALAPELFDVDDLGQSVLLIEGEIPEELVERARLAAANCPEFAIKVVEA